MYLGFNKNGGSGELRANFTSGLFQYGSGRIVYMTPQTDGSFAIPPQPNLPFITDLARYKEDVIIANFAGTSLIAARKFVTNLSELPSQSILFERSFNSGFESQHVLHSKWENNGASYSECRSLMRIGSIGSVDNCPSTSQATTASVSIDGQRLKLTKSAANVTYIHALKMGNAVILVQSSADATSSQFTFRIGVSPLAQIPTSTFYPVALYMGNAQSELNVINSSLITFQTTSKTFADLVTNTALSLVPQQSPDILGLWGGIDTRQYIFTNAPP
jgi:hypothetical protein